MKRENQKELTLETKTYETVFDVVIDIHARGIVYDDNNSENFIHRVAIGCNYAGIAPADAKMFIAEKYSAEETIVSAIIDTVYQQFSNEYATKALMYNLKVRNNHDEEDWMKLPYIPDEVFQELPPILQRAVSVFPEKRERDTFFTGALVVLSGLFNWVHGIYRGRKFYPNLYCFIVAPAGSGKGSMLFAKELGIPFHRVDNDKLLFIPANISAASLYQELDINGGTGIIFESEADTMAASFKQEWGEYSDILRKAFQNETISLKRKDVERGRRSYIEVQKPKLSVALSGTKNQVRGIIDNTEDGLFSRFLFYTFRSDPVWKNSTGNDLSLEDFFKDLAVEIPEIVNNLSIIEKFDFTEEQWQIFNERFSAWQNEFVLFFSEESISIIRRMGLITFRIAMILSFVRQGSIERNENETILYCDDIDFYLSFYLIETYIQHSLHIFILLNNARTKKSVVDMKIQMFLDALPFDEFNRATAVQLGKEKVNLEERTVDKYLKKLVVAGYLIQENYGKYMKKN